MLTAVLLSLIFLFRAVDAQPTPAEKAGIEAKLTRILEENIVPFWYPNSFTR